MGNYGGLMIRAIQLHSCIKKVSFSPKILQSCQYTKMHDGTIMKGHWPLISECASNKMPLNGRFITYAGSLFLFNITRRFSVISLSVITGPKCDIEIIISFLPQFFISLLIYY